MSDLDSIMSQFIFPPKLESLNNSISSEDENLFLPQGEIIGPKSFQQNSNLEINNFFNFRKFDFIKSQNDKDLVIDLKNDSENKFEETSKPEKNIKDYIFSSSKKSEKNMAPNSQNDKTILNKKRGRKKKEDTTTERHHTKYSKENINIKLKLYCDNCIVSYINECLKLSKKYNKRKFLKFDYKYKIKSINSTLKDLKNKNLGDIIITRNSSKYGPKYKKKEDENSQLYDQIKEDEILKKIFSEEYFHFFKNVFYKSKREIKIKLKENEYKIINLPKKVKMFNDLLEKDADEKYQKKLKEYAFRYFIPNSIFIVQ